MLYKRTLTVTPFRLAGIQTLTATKDEQFLVYWEATSHASSSTHEGLELIASYPSMTGVPYLYKATSTTVILGKASNGYNAVRISLS